MQFQSMYDDGTETTRKQLLACSMSLSIAPDSCLDRLLSVWKGVVKRVYHYYQLSAKAYFTYLHVNGLVSIFFIQTSSKITGLIQKKFNSQSVISFVIFTNN